MRQRSCVRLHGAGIASGAGRERGCRAL